MKNKLSAFPAIFVAFIVLAACGGGGDDLKESQTTGWSYNDPDLGGFEVKTGYEQEAGPGLVFVEGGSFKIGRASCRERVCHRV